MMRTVSFDSIGQVYKIELASPDSGYFGVVLVLSNGGFASSSREFCSYGCPDLFTWSVVSYLCNIYHVH